MTWLLVAVAALCGGQDRDTEAVRKQLHEILGRSEFREKMPSEFWKRLREKLRLKPGDPDPPRRVRSNPCQISATGVGGMKAVFYIGLAIVAAFLIAILYQAWAKRVPAAPAPPLAAASVPSGGLDPLARDSREWALEADALYKEGRIAEAIRALYLAALSHSHVRRWIDFHPSKPNWEHVRRFAGPGTARGHLGTLTSVFELKWYGRKPAIESEYRTSREAAAGILEREGAAP